MLLLPDLGTGVLDPFRKRKTLNAWEGDHEFLLEGGVFTKDPIGTYIDFNRTEEIDPLRLRPHPREFELYYDT